ncbi:hypothetical protein KQH41_01825 [bacterium]|nr:hypothetical protein [bacterium]
MSSVPLILLSPLRTMDIFYGVAKVNLYAGIGVSLVTDSHLLKPCTFQHWSETLTSPV